MNGKKFLSVRICAVWTVLLAVLFFFSPSTLRAAVTIDFADWLPEAGPAGKVHVEFFKGLEAATQGEVKTKFHWAQSMGPARELYSMTVQGVAQVANVVPAYTPGIFPMFSLFENPIQFPNAETLSKALVRFFESGYLNKDAADVKVVGLYTLNPYILQSVKYRITKIDELKGLKIRASSPPLSKSVKALGGVPVQTTASEMYSNLSKGVTDIDISPYDSLLIFRTFEICKYITEWGMFTTDFIVAMNKKTWDSLPPPGKDYIEKNWKDYSVKCGIAYDRTGEKAKELFLKQPGREIVKFAPDEREKMDKALAPIWDAWITDMEGKGYPAKKAIYDLSRILDELGVQKALVGFAAK
jgi:TRAP-type C4-dicarboxylate transport system substrate-binding protein